MAYYRRKKSLEMDELADVRVSFDGTWSRRGHTSSYGVQAVILFDFSCVIDFNLYSSLCTKWRQMNASNPDKESEEYLLWKEAHQDKCSRNFEYSANAMEAKGAGVL